MYVRGLLLPTMVAVALMCVAPLDAQELPPFWIAISEGGAQLDAGSDARPPAATDRVLINAAPGQSFNLRAKLVGGRRAYMMWPNTYANVGRNTTVEEFGFDRMAFNVDTGAYFARGEWTVTEERYRWDTGGRGAVSPVAASGERVVYTAPPRPGTYPVTVTGRVRFHYARTTPAGLTEQEEDSGEVSRTISVVVTGEAVEQPAMTEQEARRQIMRNFNALGTGPMLGRAPTYVASAGFWNNMLSVVSNDYGDYVCGAWQGQVLEMLDGMRNSQSAVERAIFEHYDYGPIQAYYGGHQAVVIYPKGTDWRQTGTVLDPWPNQHPETFTMAEWSRRFRFGIGPSGVYEGQYPLTGGDDYPERRLRTPPEHMEVLRRLSDEQRDQYRALIHPEDRQNFIDALPAEVHESVAVSVHSPVRMMIVDSLERRVGWVDRATFVCEIPGADVDVFPEGDGEYGMLALLPLDDYVVQITGHADSTFGFMRALPAHRADNPLARQPSVQAGAGQSFFFVLSPELPEAELLGPDGATSRLEPVDISRVLFPGAVGGGTTGHTVQAPEASAAVRTEDVTITSPRPGERVAGRVTVTGTGRPGALIVVSTEARKQSNDELLRDVPGSRRKIEDDGTWQVWVAAPELPANIMEPMYYVIKAHWITPTERSESVEVRVLRAE